LKRKIAIVTSSRADYAHLEPLLQELSRHPAVELHRIAMGPHFSPTFGWIGQAISLSQLTAIECLLDSDTDVGMAKTIGVATLGLADALDCLRPDLLLLIADRYEMLASASVVLALRIPIAHIEGGETTYGAIDDAVRNALTKMSHLHFACTRHASERIARMGEEPWRITFSGSLSLDRLRRQRLLSKAQLQRELSLVPLTVHENRAQDGASSLDSPPSRQERGKHGAPSLNIGRDTVVCIYHPVTLLKNTLDEADEVFASCQGTGDLYLSQRRCGLPRADSPRRTICRVACFGANIRESGSRDLSKPVET
jgi:UDP-hydrolysing UDP-N-acetyl-D-glucosamine 2-epimerase